MQQSLVRLLLAPVDLSMDDTRALLVPQVIPAQRRDVLAWRSPVLSMLGIATPRAFATAIW
jgi:hypothetical protein